MGVREDIKNMHSEMMEWRHDLHKNPATAFDETYASDFIQKSSRRWA